MAKFIRGELTERPRPDWRGWITLAWVIFWGISYCNMALRARGQRVLNWFTPQQAHMSKALVQPLQVKDQRPDIATVIGPGAPGGDRLSGASRSKARR
jgi:hypothetical protein